MTDNSDRHFPAGYRAGREAFLGACDEAGIGVTSRVHPGATGEDGKTLFLDTATIGARDAKSALLLISGTHGVEGYFGSGVQTGLLRNGLARRALKGAKIVLLHALNPFGFAWNRRVNEDNADINRNFVDHKNPPANPAYDALADEIAPKEISAAMMKRANAKLRAYAEQHGPFALQEAISRGQYRHAAGLYYGGARESWSAAMLKDVFREELATVERLTVIDFHTGLGESGDAEMITEHLPATPAYARSKKMWGALVRSSEAGESLSAPLSGTIDSAMAAWMKGKELTFAALEVGTAPLRQVFQALQKDNWLHAHSRLDHALARPIKSEIRAAFYPDTAQWKVSVFGHAEKAVAGAIAAL
jgi:predicted deacylase